MKLNHHPLKCPLGKRDKKAAEGVVGVVEVEVEEVVGVEEAVGEGEGEGGGVEVEEGVVEEEVSKAGEIMVEEGAMEEGGAMEEEVMEIHMEEVEEVVVDIEDIKSYSI